MANKKILYVGPSWAKRNFESLEKSINVSIQNDSKYTNIIKECDLDVIDLAKFGASNYDMLKKVKNWTNFDGIIWVYCEPIIDIEVLGVATKKEFVKSENFWDLRESVNHILLNEIENLKKPVAFIGSHSDIYQTQTNKFSQMTVIHESWQRFLTDYIKYDYLDRWKDKQGWGADVAHKWLFSTGVNPSRELVDKIDDTFFIWSLLIKENLFFEVHPNKQGNILFAKAIKPLLNNWIKQL